MQFGRRRLPSDPYHGVRVFRAWNRTNARGTGTFRRELRRYQYRPHRACSDLCNAWSTLDERATFETKHFETDDEDRGLSAAVAANRQAAANNVTAARFAIMCLVARVVAELFGGTVYQ